MPTRLIATLLLLALPALALADSEIHPLATQTLNSTPTLGLTSDLLQWGNTSISYSSAWAGGEQFSLGMLTKDLRMPLAKGLDFNARFGVAFMAGSGLNGLNGEPSNTQLVLPYAALDWRPSENMHLHLSFSQGGYGNPRYGYFSGGHAGSWMSLLDDDPEAP